MSLHDDLTTLLTPEQQQQLLQYSSPTHCDAFAPDEGAAPPDYDLFAAWQSDVPPPSDADAPPETEYPFGDYATHTAPAAMHPPAEVPTTPTDADAPPKAPTGADADAPPKAPTGADADAPPKAPTGADADALAQKPARKRAKQPQARAKRPPKTTTHQGFAQTPTG